jgi:hypothetical protein
VISEVVAAILIAVLTHLRDLRGSGLRRRPVGPARRRRCHRGRPVRQLIDETITPVWEANHVWLIFALVIFWTAFPVAFAAVMTVAALPLWLAALGIVLRGAGFAFRKEVQGLRWERLLGAIFAFSSLADAVLHGDRRRLRCRRQGLARRPALDARGLDEPHIAADRRAVRRRLRLHGRDLPHRRGAQPRRPTDMSATSDAAPRSPARSPGHSRSPPSQSFTTPTTRSTTGSPAVRWRCSSWARHAGSPCSRCSRWVDQPRCARSPGSA